MNIIKKLITRACLAAALITLAPPAPAQTPVPVKVTFPFTLGTNIPTGTTITNTSVVFPLYRGRGFTYNLGAWATNASGSNVISTIRYATPVTNGGVLVTNWSTTARGQTKITNSLNGTTRIFDPVLVPPTAVDNQALGQVFTITHDHLSTIWLDSTNTFTGTSP